MANDTMRRQEEWLGRKARNTLRTFFPYDGKPLEAEPGATVPAQQSAGPQPAPVTSLAGTPKTAIGPDIKPMVNTPAPRSLGQPIIQTAAGQTQAAVTAPQAQQPFGYTKSGVTVTANDKERIFTMGTPGQDGSARATMSLKQPAAQARQTLPGQPQQQRSFQPPAVTQASGERPLTPLEISIRARDEINGKVPAGPQMPKYQGPESGLGWKTRLGVYKEQMDAYNKQTGNQNALDINAMQEAGAGSRAMLAAKGQNDGNQIAMRRLLGDERMQEAGMQAQAVDMQGKQLGLDAAKRMEAVQQAYINEQDPVKKRELGKQWLTLQGKDTSKYQIVTRRGFDPITRAVTETAYAVNPDNPSESFEIGGEATPTGAAEAGATGQQQSESLFGLFRRAFRQ